MMRSKKEEFDSLVAILKNRYSENPAKEYNQLLDENKDISFFFLKEWSRRLFNKGLSEYLFEEGIIAPKKVGDSYKKKLEDILTVLQNRYKNFPAKSLTQVKEDNPDLKIAQINLWTKELYDKTAKEYLKENGIIGHKKNAKYYSIYDVNPIVYVFDNIKDTNLSNESTRALCDAGIRTLTDLLMLTNFELSKLEGITKYQVAEIEKYMCNACLVKSEEDRNNNIASLRKLHKIVKENVNSIINNDFSAIQNDSLNEYEKRGLERIKAAAAVLDEELLLNCIEEKDSLISINLCFDSIVKRLNEINAIQVLLKEVPKYRMEKSALRYIEIFDTNKRKSLIDIIENINQYNDDVSLREFALQSLNHIKTLEEYEAVYEFLMYCGFDYNVQIENIISTLYYDERYELIIKERAREKTLEEVGDRLGVSRERVRQLEQKIRKQFEEWNSRINILELISADRGGDNLLTYDELSSYFGRHKDEMIYLLKISTERFNKDLDAFVIENDDLLKKAHVFVGSLPKTITNDELNIALDNAVKLKGYDKEILNEIIRKSYKHKRGRYLSKKKLSAGQLYSIVLEKYFEKGIHVYNSEELNTFRQKYELEIGEELAVNDRALGVRIAGVSVLAGRGLYEAKKEYYMPKQLSDRIYNYIVNNDIPIISNNAVYEKFKHELMREGIYNQYYLHGILNELYPEKLVFRRSYICTHANTGTMYENIIEYIKQFDFPVEQDIIQAHFKGINNYIIYFATADESIINYFGAYLHKSKLVLSENDTDYLRRVLKRIINDDNTYHIKVIYDHIKAENKDLLEKLNANSSFSLFSIIECLFSKEWEFERPYIANKGIMIESTVEKLDELIHSSDEIGLDEIRTFAKKHHYQFQNFLEFINEYNDTHLLVSDKSLMRIDLIDVDMSCVEEMEEMIINEIDETTLIAKLSCIYNFKKISIPWNEWLIYSVLNKWSSKLDVSTVGQYFKWSAPIVSLKNELDYTCISDEEIGAKFIEADDLTSFTDIVVDFDDFDFGELD